MKTKILFFSLLIIAFLTSCQKDGIELAQDQKCSNILTFNSVEEFNNELNNVLKLSIEEKTKWEQQKGFKSWGLSSEKFYETINPESFKDLNEVKEFVKKNSNYIQLIQEEGEYSVEIKYYNNPLRFFMNEDNLLQIGDRAYKILEKGMVSSSIQNLNKLNEIDEISFDQFKDDPDLYYSKKNKQTMKSTSCNPGDSEIGDKTYFRTSYYRTCIEIRPEYYDMYGGTLASSHYNARSQIRTLGIWWGHNSTITANVTAELVYWDAIQNRLTTVSTHDEYSSPTHVMRIDRYSEYICSYLTGYDPNPYFNNFECYADNDAASVSLICN